MRAQVLQRIRFHARGLLPFRFTGCSSFLLDFFCWSKIEWHFAKQWVTMSNTESNWVNISLCLSNLIQIYSSLLIFVFLDCETIPYNRYCVAYMENQTENGEFRFNIEYHICPSSLNEENSWWDIVENKLYSGLFIVSMVFLALLFGFVFHTQREKLFG